LCRANENSPDQLSQNNSLTRKIHDNDPSPD
jgi:hypothetical protein